MTYLYAYINGADVTIDQTASDVNADGVVDSADVELLIEFFHGNNVILGPSSDRVPNPFRYAGEYTDKETGNVYLRNRYYDPSIGRFISEDPYWNTSNMIYGDNPDSDNPVPDINAIMQSSNLYIYAMNNPIMWIDPLGLYNRAAAVQYALAYAENPKNYLRFNGSDCTGFSSNILKHGGGIKETDKWYFKYGVGVAGKLYVSTTNCSTTWRIADDQFRWIANYKNGYINGNPIELSNASQVSGAITNNNIQSGDLIYWDFENDGFIDHVSVIVSTDNGNITYAQHDSDKKDGNLYEMLPGGSSDTKRANYYVYIIKVRDDAK